MLLPCLDVPIHLQDSPWVFQPCFGQVTPHSPPLIQFCQCPDEQPEQIQIPFPEELQNVVLEGRALTRRQVIEYFEAATDIPDDALILMNKPKLTFQRKSFKGEFRGSKFRGVSKNGRSY